MSYQILIQFPDDLNPRDISHLLRARTYKQEKHLFNTNHNSVIDKASFSLVYDSLITNLIAAETRIIKCQVLNEGNPIFTGWITPTLSDTWGRYSTPG